MNRTVRTLLLIFTVIVCLSPIAQLLRTQNAWKCFNLTTDENYYAQAFQHYRDGKGFQVSRILDPMGPIPTRANLPFDATITTGIPVAWGTLAVAKWTGQPTAFSGRLFIHGSFWVFLTILAIAAVRRARSILGVLLIGLFYGVLFARLWGGNYVTYGLLGEIPAGIAVMLALFLADRKRWWESSAFAVLGFICKPTFLFFLPALPIAIFSADRRKGLYATGASVGFFGAYFAAVGVVRGESAYGYLRHFIEVSRNIAYQVDDGGLAALFKFFPANLVVLTICLGILAIAVLRSEKRSVSELRISERAALLFVLIGMVFYALNGRQPHAKHFLVLLLPLLQVAALRTCDLLSPLFARLSADEAIARGITFTAIAVWVLNVPTTSARLFQNTPRNQCPVYEQEDLSQAVLKRIDSGEIRPENTVLVSDHYHNIVYAMDWTPRDYRKLSDVPGGTTEWMMGDTEKLNVLIGKCTPEYRASTYILLHCPENSGGKSKK